MKKQFFFGKWIEIQYIWGSEIYKETYHIYKWSNYIFLYIFYFNKNLEIL